LAQWIVYDTGLASVRLRAVLPAKYLDVELTPANKVEYLHSDLVIFGKVWNAEVACWKFLTKHHIPYIVDVCDNVERFPFYRDFMKHATKVVVSTENLRKLYQEYDPVVIPDCVEGQRMAPRPIKDPPKILWYGDQQNLPALSDCVRSQEYKQAKSKFNFSLSVLSNHPGVDEWTPQKMADELEDCDAVMIPATYSDRYQLKSANRLLTGIWAGKPVIAFPLDAYQEFADYALLTEVIGEGIEMVLDGQEVGIIEGQDYIEGNYTPQVVATKWQDIIDACFSSVSPHTH